MFKTFVLALVFTVFSGVLWAAGPAQMFRFDITGAEEGIVEIAEIELRATPGGASVVDLFRNYTFEESTPAGAATWAITHNLGIQRRTGKVVVIANAVDVVAPGDNFVHTGTGVLSQRTNLTYVELEYVTGDTGEEPATPEVGDIFYDNLLATFSQWDGAAWQPMTVTTTSSALPVPDSVEADSVTWLPSGALPAQGGAALNNDVEVTFSQPVVGAATVFGASFDTPGTNRPALAVPIIEGFERRPAAAAFDGNKASKLKSKRAPTFRSPMTIQYTFWVGDPSRYPSITEYAITAPKKLTAPKSWTVMMYKDGQWVQIDQQASMRFEDGETRVFSVD